uniref:Uncharacterized protein n=1 Tax=Lactuca sativa TaxID=4236 RepID=A0A9R1VJS2_LACSA|nr:hypothetical protein LSAT_V11C500297420 [Lactuca sativa]
MSLENASQSFYMGVSQVDMMPQLSVCDPLGTTTTKGYPKLASRIKSSLEAPQKRTFSYCQGLSHYATSCSKRKKLLGKDIGVTGCPLWDNEDKVQLVPFRLKSYLFVSYNGFIRTFFCKSTLGVVMFSARVAKC